nr:IS630 family transposase [Salinibacter ruber]
MYNLPEIDEPVDWLDAQVRSEQDAQVQRRFQMLLLLKTGQAESRSAAARRLGVHRNTIPNWLGRYEEGGIEKLCEIQKPGPDPGQQSIPPEAMTALKRRLSEPEDPKQLQGDPAVVYRGARRRPLLLDGLSDRPVRSRGQAKNASALSPKKSDSEQVAFKEKLPARIEAIRAEAERPVRLFCQDKSRFGIMPITRGRITLSGVKPIQQKKPGYQNFYLYGAVEPKTGKRFLLERESLDRNGFQDFLDGFSRRFPQSTNILILDNGRFHKANKLTIPENVRLIFLPPYSPELNPIERFWEDLKDHLAFDLHETLSELKERVSEKLHSYTDEAVASLTGYQYLVDAANA